MNETLNIIIPVYNEKDNIGLTLDEIRSKVKTPNKIFVVYDFPQDNTIPAVKEYVKANSLDNIELVHNNIGKGVLNAIKKGFEVVDSEMTLVTMGDLSDDLSSVDLMVEKIRQGYDIVCGSRYMKGGRQIGGPVIKGFLSRMAGLSLNLLVGIPTHDISNSFKLYRTSVLKNITIESTGGFELGLEILVKTWLRGNKITEVPAIWKDRTGGQSKFKLLKWLPKYLKWYFAALKGKANNAKV